jgi:hypothetical protein
MSRHLYMKIGTHPAIHVELLGQKAEPEEGDYVLIREPPPTVFTQPARVRIDEVRDLGDQLLYIASR